MLKPSFVCSQFDDQASLVPALSSRSASIPAGVSGNRKRLSLGSLWMLIIPAWMRRLIQEDET